MSKKKLAPKNNCKIGYGKPPKETRFKKGQSGNPYGRPTGAKNKRSKSNTERLVNIILDEAYRTIPVNEEGGCVPMSMARANIRSLYIDAVKGDHRARKLMTDTIRLAEAAKGDQEEEEQIIVNINLAD